MQGVMEAAGHVGAWITANPLPAALLAAIVAVLTYFYEIHHPFYSGTRSALLWARSAWNPEGDQSYGAFVPFISLGLIAYHWRALCEARKGGVNAGLAVVVAGIVLFLLAVRCLQPRIALLSIPVLLWGVVLFVWGKASARILFFPLLFLVFMIPIGALTQATFRLQFFVTGMVGVLSKLIGVNIQAVGTTLTAADHSFNFEIAEGCSGIRSLMAMVMITAAYVHLTQDRLWKKLVIFGASIVFAIIGNTGRVFSIILVAKFWSKDVAAGMYHDSSGWIFFPIAVGAMMAFDRLVNLDYGWLQSSASERKPAPIRREDTAATEPAQGEANPSGKSYDY
jgi:exosortase